MKLRTKLRMAGLLVVGAIAAFALLLTLPFLKEGSSWGDIPLFLGAAGVCLVAAVVWWMFSGFRVRASLAGWAVLAVPVVAHLLMVGDLVFERFNGERLARKVVVSELGEEPITWPGFDGPVGVKLTLTINHPGGLDHLISPPELRMGPEVDIAYDNLASVQTGGSGFFKDDYVEAETGNLALLKTVLFQKVFENPAPAGKFNTFNASSRFDPSGTTVLTYHLLPGIVDYLPGQDQICLNSRLEGLPMCGQGERPASGCASPNTTRLKDPVYHTGSDLSALWMAWPALDMSARLTEALRTGSKLQGKQADWDAMHKRLEPSGLVAAGYDLCEPGEDVHTSSRICFCRDPE
jgi:hypothetical protein